MPKEPSVYLYENGYGEIRYQPMLPDARRLWKRYDGYVEETEMRWWTTTMVCFYDFKPVLYSSKKKALKVARRQMQKEERKEKSVFYPVGKENTDDEA